jgi:hypothetical protein
MRPTYGPPPRSPQTPQSIAPRRHHDVEEAFRFHVDAYEQDLIRPGLTREEAGRIPASFKPANPTIRENAEKLETNSHQNSH